MKAKVLKDKIIRENFAKFETSNKIFKTILKHSGIPKCLRIYSMQQLIFKPKNRIKCKIRNRCLFSSKSKSNYRFLKITRIILRNITLSGFYPGIKKSIW